MTDHHPEDVAAAKEAFKAKVRHLAFEDAHVTAPALIEAARISREREAAKHWAVTDPDVLKAREYAARILEEDGEPGLAADTRAGQFDGDSDVRAALLAIKGEREAGR